METGDVFNLCKQVKADIERLITEANAKLDNEALLEVNVNTVRLDTRISVVSRFEVSVSAIIEPL